MMHFALNLWTDRKPALLLLLLVFSPRPSFKPKEVKVGNNQVQSASEAIRVNGIRLCCHTVTLHFHPLRLAVLLPRFFPSLSIILVFIVFAFKCHRSQW